MKHLILILLSLVLVSCASQPKAIYLPTPVGCEIPPLPPAPTYIHLNQNATPSEFVRWCLVNLKLAKTDARACRIQIDN